MGIVPQVLHPRRSVTDTRARRDVVDRRAGTLLGMEVTTHKMHRADQESAKTLLSVPRAHAADKGRGGPRTVATTADNGDEGYSEETKSKIEGGREVDGGEKVAGTWAGSGRHAVFGVWRDDGTGIQCASRRDPSTPDAVSVHAHERHEVRPHARLKK